MVYVLNFVQISSLHIMYLINGIRHVHNLLHVIVAIASDLSPQPGCVQYEAVLIGQLVEVQFRFLRPLLPEVRVVDVDVGRPLCHKASLQYSGREIAIKDVAPKK